MKIYKFKHNVRGGYTDWVCAPNIKKARDFYSSETGVDSFEDTIVKALTKKELQSSYILDRSYLFTFLLRYLLITSSAFSSAKHCI